MIITFLVYSYAIIKSDCLPFLNFLQDFNGSYLCIRRTPFPPVFPVDISNSLFFYVEG